MWPYFLHSYTLNLQFLLTWKHLFQILPKMETAFPDFCMLQKDRCNDYNGYILHWKATETTKYLFWQAYTTYRIDSWNSHALLSYLRSQKNSLSDTQHWIPLPYHIADIVLYTDPPFQRQEGRPMSFRTADRYYFRIFYESLFQRWFLL